MFGPNLPKNGFWSRNFKNLSPDSKSALPRKLRKRKLRFEIQENNVGIRISILEIPCVPILRKNWQFWVFGPKFAQKSILGSKFQKSKSGFRISILKIFHAPIFRQNRQLQIFGPKFALKWVLGSRFGINTSKIPYVPIFSQNEQLLVFWPKFGEIAQLRAIICFKYCWGCSRELGGGWNELGGGRWSWVEVGARFSNTLI